LIRKRAKLYLNSRIKVNFPLNKKYFLSRCLFKIYYHPSDLRFRLLLMRSANQRYRTYTHQLCNSRDVLRTHTYIIFSVRTRSQICRNLFVRNTMFVGTYTSTYSKIRAHANAHVSTRCIWHVRYCREQKNMQMRLSKWIHLRKIRVSFSPFAFLNLIIKSLSPVIFFRCNNNTRELGIFQRL
jgi:hypothetical protein